MDIWKMTEDYNLKDIIEYLPQWLLPAVLIITFFFRTFSDNYPKLIELFKLRSSRKYLEYKDHISTLNENFKNSITSFCVERYKSKLFYEETGIYAEGQKIDRLIEFHDKLQGLVSWKEIKKSLSFITFEVDGSITFREPTKWEKIEFRSLLAVGVFCCVISIILFSRYLKEFGLPDDDITFREYIVINLMLFIIFYAGLLLLSNTLYFNTRKRISTLYNQVKDLEYEKLKDSRTKCKSYY